MVTSSRLLYYGIESYIKEQIFLIEHKNTGTKAAIKRIKHTVRILKNNFKAKLKRGKYTSFYLKTIPVLSQIIRDLKNAKNSTRLGETIMYLNWAKIRIYDMRYKLTQ